ncbi:MAG: serine/threonine protein kinase [Planctomycetes bacterium]|nr:serine/threonine protein kinase [Planctomycetota bacterium]
MPAESSNQFGKSSDRISLVLRDAIARRLAGEELSDEQLIHANGDLMPDLANHLRELRRVEAARSLAEHSSSAHLFSTVETPRSSRIHAAGIQPDTIPGYQVIRELHRGGQGVVYLATQLSTRRHVAIKVLREGPFAGARDRARFEREVHLLARLRHPNIIAIHDSGFSADHYYFVMDYVDGAPLDRWAESERRSDRLTHSGRGESSTEGMPLPAIVQLFRKISDAVNAAHLLGIIHRDLKPANVLVEKHGEPRILDFGLAKITTDSAMQDNSSPTMTREGIFLGSLPWSSPEQARGDNEHVDIRSDVYSLGVMLYQTVTGRFPYDVLGSVNECVNHILHTNPVRPRSIGATIDDDAETIILKCLSKEPERRYQSAGELSRELSRYLDGRPIEAKRDSGWYVLRKWMRRHRLAAVAAISLFLFIGATAVVLGFMYREQSRLRIAAESAARKASRTTQFLQDMIASVDPNLAKGKPVAVRDVLDAASRTLEDELASEPEVAAAIHRTIGNTYETLGEAELGEAHHRTALEIGRRVLGDDHPDTLAAMNGLATSLESLNRFDEAEVLFRQCLDASRRVLGEKNPATIDALHNLGNQLRNIGRLEEAETLLKQALATSMEVVGEEHPGTLITKKVLAGVWQDLGEYDKAEPALREVLAVQSRVLGENSPKTIGTKQNLAMLLKATGRIEEAEPLYRELLESMRVVYEPDHPETLRLMNSFGRLLVAQRRLDEAHPPFRETLDAQLRLLGKDHVHILITTNTLALLLQEQGRLEDAEPLARRALEAGRKALGDEHPDVLVWMNNLGNLLSRKGLLAEAEPLYRQALDARRRVLGADHPATQNSLSNYAQVLADLNRMDEAEPYFRLAVEDRRRIQGDDQPDTLTSQSNLARFLLAADRLVEAQSVAQHVLEVRERLLGDRHPDTLLSMGILGRALMKQSHAKQAEALLQKALKTALQTLPPHHGNVPFLQVAYGTCLTDLGRYEEAEKMLLEGRETLSKLVGSEHPRARECSEALAKLYAAWGKPERAAAIRMLPVP